MKQVYIFVRLIVILTVSFFLFLPANAQPPTISYQSVITGLSAPVDIVNAHDGTNRLFIAQQGGVIKVWNGTMVSDL